MSCAANEFLTPPMLYFLKKISNFVLSALLLMTLGGCSFHPTPDVFDFRFSPFVAPNQNKSFLSWEPVVISPTLPSGLKTEFTKSYAPYLLDTGDHIRILIYKEPELSHTYSVDHEGYISLPLVGSLKARGKTPRELAEALRNRLVSESYLKDPHVAVEIVKHRPFFIYGGVKNGGQYPYVANMSAETAVAIAGGLTPRGNDRIVRVTRRTNGYIEKRDVPPEYLLMPGDLVFVYSGLF